MTQKNLKKLCELITVCLISYDWHTKNNNYYKNKNYLNKDNNVMELNSKSF